MKFIKQKLIILFFIFGYTSAIFALHFSYDNYSNIPLLKYSFSFTGKNWFKSDEASALEPQGFKTIDFGKNIPYFWEIEPPAGQTLSCWKLNDHDKKPIKSILEIKEEVKQDNLLLDVIDSDKQNFIAVITDLDGEHKYSDFIECNIF